MQVKIEGLKKDWEEKNEDDWWLILIEKIQGTEKSPERIKEKCIKVHKIVNSGKK